MSGPRLAGLAIVVAAALAIPVTAASAAPVPQAAVIGTGWTQVDPSKTIQVVSHGTAHPHDWATTTQAAEDGVSYSRSGGVETFKLLSKSSNRVEVRVHNDYKTGLRHFEGDLKVAGPTEDESCMQIFGNDGPGATTLMIRAYAADGGTLRGLGKVLATGVFGKWVHVNVIHDATANKVSVYLGGKLVASGSGPTGTHYFKYGVYGTLQAANAQTQWKNVKFFQK
ncbi:hypothetical protein DMA12_45045 [Amycolatopsis balhimycina DSM 5908]|uniref:Polysaccharide lyase family 7 protein n=1 Tax=Amycolatopsis balhimycina DSM 5908 TaxID=1081091 RepID=A0A428VWT8_AMYBA|nr:hypothetical protein [Amycolatopsis balhimycina]RSM35239.1 hypothetical protein DMA12_45045 [Amycolatopsis balhimycina DSM 5908]